MLQDEAKDECLSESAEKKIFAVIFYLVSLIV